MLVCYHKEAFVLGFTSAFFIGALIILFEDVIVGWLEKIGKILDI